MSMKPRIESSPKQIPNVVSGPHPVTEVGSTSLQGTVTSPKNSPNCSVPGTVTYSENKK